VFETWALFSQVPFLLDTQPFPTPLTIHGAGRRFFYPEKYTPLKIPCNLLKGSRVTGGK